MAADQGPNKGKKAGPSGPAKAAAAAGATQGAAQKGGARKGAAPKGSVRDRAIDAALALAAEIPWREVTLQDIAERADLPLADVVEEFPTRLSVVRGFTRRIDREVLNNLDPEIAGEPARERLFDVLIGRFEALNAHKAAVRSLWEALSRDPEALAMLN
ncbi:MAG TPA: TetR/AcrR family transcriptional regulator, partial [Hyphomicrobiales bacterium]|nr:TetR/AcrR family transcriptional regulator [Hyphomicrobiales bacterium]